MAVDLARVPRALAPELHAYLLERDVGGPTARLLLAPPTVALLAGDWRCDRLTWSYTADVAPRGRPHDGFAVWWDFGAIADPPSNGVLLVGTARAFTLWVPAAATVSYAIAPWRLVHGGMRLGVKTLCQVTP